MDRHNENVRIRVDNYTRLCLTAIAALLTLTVIGLWSDHGPAGPSAEARTVKAQDTIAGTGKAHSDTVSSRTVLVQAQQETNQILLRECARGSFTGALMMKVIISTTIFSSGCAASV